MRFSAGAVLSRGFAVLGRNLGPFLVLSLLTNLPVFAVQLAVGQVPVEPFRPDQAQVAQMPRFDPLQLLPSLLSIVMSAILAGALTYGVVQDLRGRRAGLGQTLSVGLSRALPVVGISILVGFLIGLGFIALVVPGLILLCALFAAVPAAVIERLGVGALGRSFDLTKGHRMSIFGIVLAIGIVGVVFGLVLRMAIGAGASLVATSIVFYVVSIFLSLYNGTCQAVAYHDLRVEKEGASTADIASVFD